MALSKCALDTIYVRSGLSQFHILDDTREFVYEKCVYDFARAIEAEVRKQDEALIRQCMEALECAGAYTALIDDYSLAAIQEAYKAARARLEGRP